MTRRERVLVVIAASAVLLFLLLGWVYSASLWDNIYKRDVVGPNPNPPARGLAFSAIPRDIGRRGSEIKCHLGAQLLRGNPTCADVAEVPRVIESNFYNLYLESLEPLGLPRLGNEQPSGALLHLRGSEFVSLSRAGILTKFDRSQPKKRVSARIELGQDSRYVNAQFGRNEYSGLGVRDMQWIELNGEDALAFTVLAENVSEACVFLSVYDSGVRKDDFDLETLSPKKVWETPSCVDTYGTHLLGAGGSLLPVRDNVFQVALGDMNKIDQSNAYNPYAEWGAVLEVDLNFVPPRFENFATGFRNPSGFAILHGPTAENAVRVVVEQGPRGGDEINILEFEGDYGWPKFTYGSDYAYNGFPKPGNNHRGGRVPAFAFVPSPALQSGIGAPKGFSQWRNEEGLRDLLVGSLKGQSLYRCRLDPSSVRFVYCEQIFIGERIRDIAVGADEILLLTDFGRVLALGRS